MSVLGDRVVATARQERRLNDPGYRGTIDNRSDRVDVYLQYVGRLPSNPNRPGESWCGDFVRWCYHQNGFTLPSAVSGGSALKQYGDAHPAWVVWRAGQPPCAVQAADIFVVADLTHVAMVLRSQTSGASFDTIEGNQTDPAHPNWGNRGILERTRTFLSCAMILRPPQQER